MYKGIYRHFEINFVWKSSSQHMLCPFAFKLCHKGFGVPGSSLAIWIAQTLHEPDVNLMVAIDLAIKTHIETAHSSLAGIHLTLWQVKGVMVSVQDMP
jgi:hypothetical protein